MTTPPGVTATWTRHMLAELDPGRGPVGWLMREDGSQVCDGYHPLDIWDENALRCPCRCHLEAPAVGHPYEPHPPPPATGPETWPESRVTPAPPPRPVPGGQQLAIDDNPARSTT